MESGEPFLPFQIFKNEKIPNPLDTDYNNSSSYK